VTNKHLFFDLDRTLWDFDKNSKQALIQLFSEARLIDSPVSFEDFHKLLQEGEVVGAVPLKSTDPPSMIISG
jgi:FMN phosphatase YigB (HAD superfamily)